MFFKRNATAGDRRKRNRSRVLRVESLDRRELMDGHGLLFDAPASPGLQGEGEPPAHFSRQSSSVLVPGSVRNESIARVGEIDRFTIQATAGQVFQLALAPGGQLHAHLRVVEPGGGKSLVNTTSTRALATNITANKTGSYLVEVQGRHGQSVGAYRLGLESLSIPSNDAKSLRVGDVADGRLAGSIQVDQYRVTAVAGQRFQVSMASTNGMDTVLRVYEPGGRRLLVNTSSSGAVSPQFVASRAGTYIVQVQARNLTSVGGYRVGVESLSQPSLDARPMAIGSVVTGQLTGTLQADQYRITAVAGQRFQLAMAPVAGMNTSLRVSAPGGRLLVNTSSSSVVRTHFQAPAAGTYVIHVQARNLTSLGQYRIGIESLSTPSPDARPLAIGATLRGRLQQAIQADQFRVTARSGQRLRLDLTPLAGLNTRIRVIDPSGRAIVNTSTSTARAYDFTTTITGNYIVQIEAQNGTSLGRYRVGLRRL